MKVIIKMIGRYYGDAFLELIFLILEKMFLNNLEANIKGFLKI